MKPALIFMAFIAAAIIGTVTHEVGHYLACCYYHLPAHIAYASTQWNVDILMHMKQQAINEHNIGRFNRMLNNILLAGPSETILTSVVGSIWLLWLAKRSSINAYRPLHLTAIVLALFCSREIFNATTALINLYILSNREIASDEYRILAYYHIPQLAGQSALLISCAIACLYICFVLVRKHRKALILSGIAGSLTGYALWMYWLGPTLLP